MGRKSVRTERRAEILTAFAALANERGLHNCSLRAIAENVGVTMPLLLHHFSSRDEMVAELITLVADDLHESYAAGGDDLWFDGDASALVDFFFAGSFRRLVSANDALFADLLAESNRDLTLRGRLRDLYRTLESVIDRELAAVAPACDPEQRLVTGYALVCMLESNEMFLRMGFRDGRADRAHAAATQLVAALRSHSALTRRSLDDPETL